MRSYHQPGEIIDNKYRVIDILGEGNSGVTYGVRELKSDRELALKAFSFQHMTDWKMMELFEREAQTLQKLNHPAIPKYIDYFQVDTEAEKTFYIAQQLAPGKSLATLVADGWRGDEAEVKRIAVELLKILVYLHLQKPTIVHRDLKPHNIIYGDDGKIFLVDFGAVKQTYHNTMLRGSTVVGTYGYMAPEQFRGKAIPATDLYSLGATILFLLTHRSPAELPVNRLKINFRSSIQISEEFADWLEKILEPNLSDRFLSAREALEILQPKSTPVIESFSKKRIAVILAFSIFAIALFRAIEQNKYAVFNYLGLTDYLFAAIDNNSLKINDYLAKGGNLNIKNTSGKTLLHEQVEKNPKNIHYIHAIVAKKPNINLRNKLGQTPLHLAKTRSVAEILINGGVDVNAVDKQGKTALHAAMKQGNIQLTRYLIESKVELNIQDNKGNTPLYIAYFNAYKRKYSDRAYRTKRRQSLHKNLFFYLISQGASFSSKETEKLEKHINQINLNSYSKAVCNLEKTAFLMSTGVDLSAQNPNWLNEVFHAYCSRKERFQIVEFLINAGFDVNIADNKGKTPLHYVATLNSNPDISLARLLIEAGADVNAYDLNGNTPLDLARSQSMKYTLINSRPK